MNKKFWRGKKILITGAGGFLGQHVLQLVKVGNSIDVFAPSSKEYDLRNKSQCKKVVQGINIVIHLAAKVGGIGFNINYPGEMFYDNIMIGTQLMEEARRGGVEKFVAIGTVCSYPKFTPVPFKEENIWNGYPEETNAPYGLAKKMQLVQAQAYRRQYGFNAITLIPVNMYGPGDNFDESSSHVIPALIKKVIQAKLDKKNECIVWGTGRATREFLFVEDSARAIIMATEKYNKGEPVNIGAGFEISIKELVTMICNILHFKGKIVWDTTKPDGQPRRKLDTSRAFQEFGFQAKTPFSLGLEKTIDWYQRERKIAV